MPSTSGKERLQGAELLLNPLEDRITENCPNITRTFAGELASKGKQVQTTKNLDHQLPLNDSKLKAQFKIINGTCDPYGAHPWTAQIQVRSSRSTAKYYHYCGGTILTEDYVLTAAHCLK